MIKNNPYTFKLFFISMFAVLGSCTGSKYLSNGEHYYDGAKIEYTSDSTIKDQSALSSEISAVLTPKPNTKLLGSRPSVWFYHIAGEPKKDSGFKHWLKYKVGSKPVMLRDTKPEVTANRLKGILVNQGYFLADVNHITNLKRNSAITNYKIKLDRPYRIRNVIYPQSDSTYKSIISAIQEESFIKPNQRYSLDLLQKEQKRIEDYLENKGFYFFDDHHLIYEADSTVGDYEIDLKLDLSEKTPNKAKRIYTLSNIYVYPDYSISDDSLSTPLDTVALRNYTFIDGEPYIRHRLLSDLINLDKGEIYSQQAENYTLEHLINLGTYKFANIKFTEADSSTLDTHIYLTPLTKKSLRFEGQAISKSNNFIGPASSISFRNRNTFGGAELLEIKLNGSYEVQVGGQNNPALNALEVSLESTLTIPRLITPFNIDYYNSRYIPDTKINFGVRLQERLNFFRLNSFEASYGFRWKESITKRHELYPVSISYVQLSNESEEFETLLANDVNLSSSLEDQFILGATYNYTYSSKADKDADQRRHHFYFSGNIDISGNLLSLTQQAVGSTKNEEGQFQLLQTLYAQYLKSSIDFRHFLNLGKNRELASRFIAGAAWAYGNSDQVPFIKQFSSGGSNSIRAFRARSVGPGAFLSDDEEEDQNFRDQTGDIKLETSIEYRAPIYGVVTGALFVDAGNVWLSKFNEQKLNSQFRSDEFLSQIAIGTGAGIRFDFSFFLLRFDLAFPLRKPSNQKGERWVIDNIDLGDRQWRRDNLLLNIAIGYPF